MKKVYADKDVLVIVETMIPKASPRLWDCIAEALPSETSFPIAPLYDDHVVRYLIPFGGFDTYGRFQLGYNRLEAKVRSDSETEKPSLTPYKLRHESSGSSPILVLMTGDDGLVLAFSRSNADNWTLFDLEGPMKLGSLGKEKMDPVFGGSWFGALDLALIDLATEGKIHETIVNIIPLSSDAPSKKLLAADLWTAGLTELVAKAYTRTVRAD